LPAFSSSPPSQSSTDFSPNYTFFLVMRGLYGIGMGGYWGIGASYAMESIPRRWRGVLSGRMQSGYPFGYLLAVVAMQWIAPVFGWRSMFLVGSRATLLIVILTVQAPESDSWKMHHPPSLGHIFHTLFKHLGIFAYLLLAMAVMISSPAVSIEYLLRNHLGYPLALTIFES
jgi:SHS family lactate transporter-like MFS transporter